MIACDMCDKHQTTGFLYQELYIERVQYECVLNNYKGGRRQVWRASEQIRKHGTY
jgi:hypothetical protein